MRSAGKLTAMGALLVLTLVSTLSAQQLSSQEARWDSLEKKVVRLYKQGRFKEALPLATEAVHVAEQAFGESDSRTIESMSHLAEIYVWFDRYDSAEVLLHRILRFYEKKLGSDDPSVAKTLNNLSSVYYHQGHYALAESLSSIALQTLEERLGPTALPVAGVLRNLGDIYRAQARYARAESCLTRALDIQRKKLGGTTLPLHEPLRTWLGYTRMNGSTEKLKIFYKLSSKSPQKDWAPTIPMWALL